MVYSEVPTVVVCTPQEAPIADQDSWSLSTSSEYHEKATPEHQHHQPRATVSPVRAWNPDFYEPPTFSQIEVFQHQHKRPSNNNPQSVMVEKLPSWTEMPKYSELDDRSIRLPRQSFTRGRSLSFKWPSRRVSLHSRVEAIQHQIAKPFRKLGNATRIASDAVTFDCFGNKVMDDVFTPNPMLTDAPRDNPSKLQSDPDQMIQPASTASSEETEERQEWQEHSKVQILPSTGTDQELRWLYSRPLWPAESRSGKDPPGRYLREETTNHYKERAPFRSNVQTIFRRRMSDSKMGRKVW